MYTVSVAITYNVRESLPWTLKIIFKTSATNCSFKWSNTTDWLTHYVWQWSRSFQHLSAPIPLHNLNTIRVIVFVIPEPRPLGKNVNNKLLTKQTLTHSLANEANKRALFTFTNFFYSLHWNCICEFPSISHKNINIQLQRTHTHTHYAQLMELPQCDINGYLLLTSNRYLLLCLAALICILCFYFVFVLSLVAVLNYKFVRNFL